MCHLGFIYSLWCILTHFSLWQDCPWLVKPSSPKPAPCSRAGRLSHLLRPSGQFLNFCSTPSLSESCSFPCAFSRADLPKGGWCGAQKPINFGPWPGWQGLMGAGVPKPLKVVPLLTASDLDQGGPTFHTKWVARVLQHRTRGSHTVFMCVGVGWGERDPYSSPHTAFPKPANPDFGKEVQSSGRVLEPPTSFPELGKH